VVDAIKFTLDHYRRQSASVPVDEAVRQLVASKRAAGRSERYICTLSFNLERLAPTLMDGRFPPLWRWRSSNFWPASMLRRGHGIRSAETA
jgi:hypothetical protein